MLSVAPMLVGHSVPRIGTPPSGDASRAREAVGFADDLGIELLPWQVELFDRALRTTGDRWTHRLVLAITARQSGKTTLSSVRALAELCLWGGRLVITAAQSRDVALHSFRFTCEVAEHAGLDIVRIRRAVGSEELVLDVMGREVSLKVVSSTSGGARGLSPDLVICDELQAMKTHEPFGAMEKARRARPNSQCWCVTSEGTAESVVLDALKTQGRAAAESGEVGPLGFYEWSAREDRSADDRTGWQESNPALGHLIAEDTIAAELQTDAPENFEREVLGRRTTVARPWLPAGTWEATADREATVPDSAVTEVTFAVDASPDLAHAAIAVGWVRPDGRVHVELTDSFDGPGASASAETRLRDLVGRWQPRALAVVARGPAEALAGRVAAGAEVDLTAVSGTDFERAARSFFESTSTGRLVHPPDPVLADHLGAAQQGTPGTFALRGPGNVTGAVAATLAVWAADRVPVVTAPKWVAW